MVLRCSSHPHAPLYPPQCVIEAQICAHIRSFKCVFPSLPLSHRPFSVFVSLAPCHAALHRPRVIQHCRAPVFFSIASPPCSSALHRPRVLQHCVAPMFFSTALPRAAVTNAFALRYATCVTGLLPDVGHNQCAQQFSELKKCVQSSLRKR